MKFSIIQSHLTNPLQLILGGVEKRQTLPVLANVLIQIKNKILTITSTDLEIEISLNLSLTAETIDGEITVPAKKLLDICKSLPHDKHIDFILNKDKLKISSARNRFILSTIDAKEFPNIEGNSFDIQFDVSSHSLKMMMDKTQFSMAQQDIRYYLNGMLIELHKNQLLTVATDGHRLALSKLKLNNTINPSLIRAIIPRKGILEANKLLSSIDENVTLFLSKNHIRMNIGHFIFTSKLVDGEFPDYNKVLPKNAKRILLCNKHAIKEAFLRASILCNEKFKGVRLLLTENKLTINANNPEQEEAIIELDVHYQNEAMEIGFNVSYLLDAINAIKDDEIKFSLGDSNSTALIESSQSSDSTYVIMPMRL
jgi:DNA polymerase-3 subunit beta